MCFRVVPLSMLVTYVVGLCLSRYVLRMFYSSSLGVCYMCSRVVPL